ncbi:MAG: hypothetical protein PW789_04475 [Edaphobacter sp.]|uniref:hypothetical protein n=1 Tax=Edaphobacter sp. TaxID=1934404 RepID=UPI002393C96A|nr:hypothetical protein [Edaphobacter sp.]MDE1175843.1 hypothetical protein [Edaphobacter sp.]
MQTQETLSPTTKRELVQRIIASGPFNKSERLSSFLLHICELEVQGRAAELSEKEIGHSVFRLPIDYDPSTDGIVRSHASRLRRRLEMYYMREGSEEHLRIVIPRGSYQPRFERIELNSAAKQTDQSEVALSAKREERVESSSPEGSPLPPLIKEEQKDTDLVPAVSRRVPWLGIVAGFIVMSLISGALLYRHFRTANLTDISPLAALFTKGRPTILVPGDSGLVIWQETQHRNLTLPDYLASNYSKTHEGAFSPEEQIALSLLRRRYTSMVDLEIVQKLSNMAQIYQAEPLLRFARDVRPNDLKYNNVVLIGSSETNPWNQMFQGTMNFVLTKDHQRTLYTIENRHPAHGEPAQWFSDPADRLKNAYCKVSYLANPSGAGNVLVLEGTSMAGTECAWEFISNQGRLKQFLKMVDWRDHQAPHFEVLLRTSNLGGNAAASEIVAWRISN